MIMIVHPHPSLNYEIHFRDFVKSLYARGGRKLSTSRSEEFLYSHKKMKIGLNGTRDTCSTCFLVRGQFTTSDPRGFFLLISKSGLLSWVGLVLPAVDY